MPQLRGHEGDEVILSGFASHLDEPFRSVSIAWQRRLLCARGGYSPRCFLSVASRGAGGPGLCLEVQQPPPSRLPRGREDWRGREIPCSQKNPSSVLSPGVAHNARAER